MNPAYMRILSTTFFLAILTACGDNDNNFDATGNFEAHEVIVAAEVAGKIMELNIEEGKELKKGEVVGYIDTTQLYLKKKQLQYSIRAVLAKKPETSTQLAAIQEQIETSKREQKRVENLFKEDAATQKQLDDINSQLEVLQKQYNAAKSSLNVTTQSLNSEVLPLKAQLEQVEDQIQKSIIRNPINGIVLTEYLMEDEVAGIGKGLYKIANLSTVILRAYVSGSQLPQLKLGQNVDVFVDASKDDYKKYSGTVIWVSDKAEFTPKTIQTKEERANLVYAVKISVKNDGYLKIGMYGEVKLNPNNK
jgi:HlyD family secretion protein